MKKIDKLEIEYISTNKLIPYDKNPRKNDPAVPAVIRSIESFGFKVPLVVDEKNVIVCGHTRYKAAIKMGLDSVPCIKACDLTSEQIRAFRLADNKVAELAGWDDDLLDEEMLSLPEFDFKEFGFVECEKFDDMPEIEDEQAAPTLKGARNVITIIIPPEIEEEIDNIKAAVTEATKGWVGLEIK